MKARLLLICFIFLLFASSCYVVKYTHSQVMDMAILDKTEDEILNNFGIPDERETEGYFEVWSYYDYGQKPISIELPSSSASRTNIRVNPSYGVANRTADIYEGGVIYRRANDYIKVTFQNGRAIQWSTSGIDYTVEEFKPVKTVFTIIGSVVLSTGLVILLL